MKVTFPPIYYWIFDVFLHVFDHFSSENDALKLKVLFTPLTKPKLTQ